MKAENSSNKIFIIVIALLLIANVVTLTMLLTDKKPDADDRKNAMRNYLKSEVNFSDAQLVAFDTVKSRQRAQAKLIYDEIRLRKQNNLKKIGNDNFSDSSLKNAALYAASQQENMEMNMLEHLKDIRNLCTPPQRAIFDTGFYKIMVRPNTEAKKKEK
jgi:flagellar basal body-associated protein FliL